MSKKVKRIKYISIIIVAIALLIGVINYVQSQTTLFKFSPDFAYVLLAYNTSVSSDSYIYCSNLGWSDDNTTLLLSDTYMGSGISISELEISIQNANMTLTGLGQEMASFDLVNFDTATITLVGFGAEPAEIKVDGVLFSNYTYTSSTDQLSFGTNGTQVVLAYPSSSLTPDEAVGIAVGFGVAILMVALVMIIIFSRRKNNE